MPLPCGTAITKKKGRALVGLGKGKEMMLE